MAKGYSELGSLYYEGNGVKQDHSKAIEYHQRACRGTIAKSCLFIGNLYSKGKSVKRDYSAAKKYYSR
ncbi:MAG: sel1 repeat family protein, partial [Campylobacteraceae bacterium]|nr:sel1 repeat family protein [Campylobacteraceae bacterium]